MDEQATEQPKPDSESSSENLLGIKLLVGGGIIFLVAMMARMLISKPPIQQQPVQPVQPVQTELQTENPVFAEQQYEENLWRCIYLGQRELEQLQGVTSKQFQRDIEDNINNEGISPRITLLRKLNYTRGELTQRLQEQTHFGGAAQSRGVVRAPLLDSLSVLYAMKAELDGIAIQNVELSPAEYLDCLDALDHWGRKAEINTPEFQKYQPSRQTSRQPSRQLSRQEQEQQNNDWQPY